MDVVEMNISDDVLALITDKKYERGVKRALFVPNVILSFVGKLPLAKVTIRTKLPNRPAGVDVCVIVKDLKRTDYNASNEIWKRKWQVDGGKYSSATVTFLPLRELKLCYQSYESRRKLASTFDVFLADERIVHHLPTNLGKAFYGNARDKVPIPVTLDGKDLVKAVDDGLHSCLVLISGKGTTESVVVGNTSMPKDHIRENIVSVIRDVLERWPGGSTTLRSIYVRGAGPSVPIYFDNADIDKELSEAKLREVRMQTLAPSHPQSKLSTRKLLEAAKDLPITGNQTSSPPTFLVFGLLLRYALFIGSDELCLTSNRLHIPGALELRVHPELIGNITDPKREITSQTRCGYVGVYWIADVRMGEITELAPVEVASSPQLALMEGFRAWEEPMWEVSAAQAARRRLASRSVGP
ncbi:Ribosomal L1 domain-containing protein 1 [Taenia crassiceps]|uniref:Ribosomal L1 domain-containing protein 1 n=1 Tax=Taenia crassiceps TaxID=6207 RepID=A0ABR4QLE8_9CEST